MIIYQDWPVRNSQRRYPLADTATAASDAGVLLPETFIVDANIWVPKTVTGLADPLQFVFLSSAMRSDALVSCTFMACPSATAAPTEFVPIASLVLQRPVVAYKNYALIPMLDGVMGWVVFGNFVKETGEAAHFGFASPVQALLASRAARFYDTLPIDHVRAYTGTATARGDVKISTDGPIVSEVKDMLVDGELLPRKMLVLSMEQTEQALSSFAGLCGRRPETGNCLHTPITSIAGVQPDCSGNILITFSPEIIVRYFQNPLYPAFSPSPYMGGICLDTAYSLDDACSKDSQLPDDNGVLPREFTWQRPCDLPLPFYSPLAVQDDFKSMVVTSGFVYIFDSEAYASAGYGDSAEIGPCFNTYNPENTYRSHVAGFGDTPSNSKVGLFVFDTVNTRIIFTVTRQDPDSSEMGSVDIVRYSKVLNEVDSTLYTAPWGDVAVTSVGVVCKPSNVVDFKVNGAVVYTHTFAGSDIYYDPTGKAGIYVGGGEPGVSARPSVKLADYNVADSIL